MLRSRYGKSCTISATDIDELRIQRLRQNNERLGLGLDISSVDWTNEDASQDFDLIWIDVPCSATGVISKHPEVAIQQREDDQNLENTTQIVGVFMESTLSRWADDLFDMLNLKKRKNDMQIAAFLETNTDALLLEAAPGEMIESHLGGILPANTAMM